MMLFLPIIDTPNALEALVSAISEQEWLSSRGYSFSMFKREQPFDDCLLFAVLAGARATATGLFFQFFSLVPSL